jgi:hypothetical protein
MRFATARDVLLEHPQIALGFQSPLEAVPSATYLEGLVAAGKWPDAVAFVAHLLPRREAVWWAAQAVRSEPRAFVKADDQLLAAAEAWVRDPIEEKRRVALALGDKADAGQAATWVVRAAGWSGGTLIDVPGHRAVCLPHMSPAAARGAVLLAGAASETPATFLDRCIRDAIAMIERAANGWNGAAPTLPTLPTLR